MTIPPAAHLGTLIKLWLIAIFLLFISPTTLAQTDSTWFKIVQEAEKYKLKKSYDSALLFSIRAIGLAEKRHYETDRWYSHLMNLAGNCFEQKSNAIKAHEYYSKALNNARKHNHANERSSAYLSLNELHKKIMQNNWKFNYTPPAATIEADVYYPIEKVEHGGDSLVITVAGGRLDGVSDSSLAGGIYTRKSTNKETIKRDGGYFIGTANIKRITSNRTILVMRRPPDTIPMVADLVKISSDIPLLWNKLPYKSSLINAVVWTDNYKQRIYDRRYLYYFIDSNTIKDINGAMTTSVEEVMPLVAADSADGGVFGNIIDDGLFKGFKLYKALEYSGEKYFNYFQNYALDNAESYRGNDYRFSEVYATWVVNKAPMLPNDLREFLIKLRTAKQSQIFSTYLRTQVEKDKLADKWFDEGMQFAYSDDIKQARAIARLLYDYGIGNDQPGEKGWACYLEAVCLKKLGNVTLIDSLLNVSAQYFQLADNKEGALWVKKARETFFRKPQVAFSVQSGHLMPFNMSVSPNSRFFATGSDDHLIKIWDVYTAKEIKTIDGHTKEVSDVIFSPGGRYLASCSDDSTIKIWNGFTFELLQTIPEDVLDGKLAFSPDSKKIVSVGADSSIRVWDVFNGTLLHTLKKHKARLSDITFFPTRPNVLVSAGRDSMIYYWDIDSGKSIEQARLREKLVRTRFSNNGKFMYTTYTDSSLTLWKTDNYTTLFSTKIQAGVILGSTFLSQPFFSPDNKYLIYINKEGKRVIEEMETLYYRSFNLLEGNDFIQEQYLNGDASFLIEKSGNGNSIRILDFSGYSFQKGFPSVNYTEIKQYQNPPVGLQFSKNDSSLYILSMNLGKLDLTNGVTTHLTNGMYSYYPARLVLNDELITPQIRYKHQDTLDFLNYQTEKIARSLFSPNREKIRVYEMAEDESLCFIGTEKGSVSAWNLGQNKLLFSVKLVRGEDSIIKRLYYDNLYKRLYVSTRDSNLLILDALTGKLIDSIKSVNTQDLVFSNEKIFISTAKGISQYNQKDFRFLKMLLIDANETDYSALAYSPIYNRLVVAASNASIYVVDPETGKVFYKKKDSKFQVSDITFSNNGAIMAVASFDNKVNLYDFIKGDLMLSIHTPLNSDYVLSDTAGNYMASKKALNGIIFNYNDGAYNFEQFDLQYNRPDLILKRTGKADSAVIESYHLAYKKRLKKAGLTEEDISENFVLPVIRIPDKSSIRPVSSASEYTFTVECFEPKTRLQSIHVLVNNSPVFGLKGYELTSLDTFQVTQKLTVPLSVGNNSIKIYCVNDKGIASLKESFEVLSKYTPAQKPKTYFIGIAVANYKDSNFNLRYSAKDVRDLALSFKKIYPDAIIDTLIDKNATKEKILALKESLLKTTMNDKVIIAVTGHGLLSDSLDFYYGTYDVVFNNPVTHGLKYDDLENLLTDIPARQKILMIDACHSGALDKETLLESKGTTIATKENTGEGGKVTTGRSSIKIKTSKVTLNNTFELMQNLFADLSNSNGTVVISAAGGLEYAFESPRWNNGVFTYCVRKGLEQKEADKDGGNSDGSVSVQELQQYVSRKVSELTNGKQRPTSRRENLDYNWNLR